MTVDRARFDYRRVMVYGVTGSGKTTAAARLSTVVGIPWHAVDDLTWQADWVSVPVDEQRQLITALLAQDEWIIDHGYGQWLDLVMPRCDLVVALDYPRLVSLVRLVRRSVLNILLRRPTCNDNRESWRQLFSADSIIRWHFRSFTRKRVRIRGWEKRSPGPMIKRFTSPRRLDRWMQGLG